jgi:hypothetical protein
VSATQHDEVAFLADVREVKGLPVDVGRSRLGGVGCSQIGQLGGEIG